MSFQFGSSQQKGGGTQTLALPAPSAAETELQKLNLEFAKRQMAEQDRLLAERQTFEASPLFTLQKQIEEKATQNILNRLTGAAPILSPEEQARLDTIFRTATQRGESDLLKFGGEIAAQRGMTIADSPIGAELLKQRRLFGEGMESQRAGASLDLGQAESLFNQQVAQFQNTLQQQAFMNRLALSGQAPPAFGLAQNLFGQRLAAAPRSMTTFGRGTQ